MIFNYGISMIDFFDILTEMHDLITGLVFLISFLFGGCYTLLKISPI